MFWINITNEDTITEYGTKVISYGLILPKMDNITRKRNYYSIWINVQLYEQFYSIKTTKTMLQFMDKYYLFM